MSGFPVVMFYVQHLFGIGHVFRATRIARKAAQQGCKIHLIWGGTDVPNIDLSGLTVHRLAAVRSIDETFSKLVHPDGRLFTDEDQAARRSHLISLFDTIRPDTLITEAFPFGRRQMHFELVPLIERARSRKNRPLIISSIRDIMQENRKQSRVAETLEMVNKFYDLVFIHGDPALIRIEDSLQEADKIMDKVRYTGLVTPTTLSGHKEPACNVLISSGGGANGYPLLNMAMDAMPFSARYPNGWRFIAGTEMTEANFEKLKARCPKHAILERYAEDMVAAMSAAKVSVSRSGYNTIGDVFRAGPASIVVPFTGGRETEQWRRAELLHHRGVAVMLDENNLTPEQLAHAIDNARPPNLPERGLNFDGASESARLLIREFEQFVEDRIRITGRNTAN